MSNDAADASIAISGQLDDMHRAVLNILDDFAQEKLHIEDTQRAVGNILEDFAGEKERLELTQRAMLNLLEDFDLERSKAEAASIEMARSLDSVRRAKEETEAANQELEAFSYSVAHDLRAPLRAMDGFSKLLLDRYQDGLDDMGRDFLRRVRAGAQRMSKLIDDLLLLSWIARTERHFEDISLSSLARTAMAKLRSANPSRVFEFIISDNLVARGDAGLIEIALENLLGNAMKFTRNRNHARIEVGCASVDGGTVYFVRDNGAGFDMDFSSKLFRPFQRLHGVEEFEGTGIGLALVARIIKRHDGRIWAEAEVDRGATFFFTIGEQK